MMLASAEKPPRGDSLMENNVELVLSFPVVGLMRRMSIKKCICGIMCVN